MVIISILAVMSVGTWVHYRSRWQQKLLTRRVRNALAFAKSEAVSRQTSIIYCGSSDKMHCDGKWSSGQLVKVKASNKLLQTFSALKSGVGLAFYSNLGHNKSVVFTEQGFTQGQQGHFNICSAKVKPCSVLILHYSGQVVSNFRR